jgi:proteasome lid subunit RPN8/RPN11
LAVNDLVLTAEQVQTIEREGSAAYPNECCGIMYGRDAGGERRVERLEPVANSFEAGEQYHRFSITPPVPASTTASTAGRSTAT